MVQVWKTGLDEKFTCPHCGAVYAVTIKRFPLRDKDSAVCESCGNVMTEWNSTSVPSFELIESPRQPEGMPGA
jgi:predicted Zn finger-like uncharacterized protein